MTVVVGVNGGENQFARVRVMSAAVTRAVPDRCVRRGVMGTEDYKQQRPQQTQTGFSQRALGIACLPAAYRLPIWGNV